MHMKTSLHARCMHTCHCARNLSSRVIRAIFCQEYIKKSLLVNISKFTVLQTIIVRFSSLHQNFKKEEAEC